MYKVLRSTVAAASLAALALSATAVTATFMTADYAYAKGGNGNGNGNGGGNGGGNGKGNGGGGKSSKSGKSDTKSSSRSGKSGGGLLKLFNKDKSTKTRTTRTRVTREPSKAPKSNGNSWKTRLDDGMLSTPSYELGAWNSAKRSPRAIANMVEKYRETGKANGAGGMIGQLVAAYEDYNGANEDLETALQDAVNNGTLDQATAQSILDGSLSSESIENALVAADLLGDEMVTLDGSTVSCDDSGAGDCAAISDELDALQADVDALDVASTDPAISDALDGVAGVEDTLATAQSTIVPKKTPELYETMKADIEDLLDISLTEPGTILPPEELDPETVEDVAATE